MADRDLLVPPIDPTPEDRSVILGDVYRPRRKSEFLLGMLRTLASGSVAIFRFGEDSAPHRLLQSVALELELLSRSFADAATLAIREAAYRAFEDPLLFPPRAQATYARGYVMLALPTPTNLALTIEQGELFSTSDGRTLRSLARVVWPAGDAHCAVPVVSETPGTVGALPPGAVTQHLSSKANYLVTNPAAIAGGQDMESDAALYARFRRYLASFRTGSRGAVLSAAENAFGSGERPRDAALILPWRIPGLNREMGHAYVVVDSGAGSASPLLLARVQQAVTAVSSAAEEISCITCNPFVISPAFEADCLPIANLSAVETRIREEWLALMDTTLIEDGTGRGTIDLLDLRVRLDRIPGILTVRILSHTSDIVVPLGARGVAGNASVRARWAD